MEAIGVTCAELDGEPAIGAEGADVVGALENFLAEDIDMLIV